ncbi:MAG: hypothetical protein AAFN77_10935 [Planctomycetota bacterium]
MQRNTFTQVLLVLAFLFLSPRWGIAQDANQEAKSLLTAKLVSRQKIKQRNSAASSTDLAVFRDQLVLTFLDDWTAGSTESCIRVMSSENGLVWTNQSTIRHEARDRYLVRRVAGQYRGKRLEDTPRLTVQSDEMLTVRAMEAQFNSREFDSRQMVGWSTNDATTWNAEGRLHEVLHWGEQIWHGGHGYAFKYGGPCGESLAMALMVTDDSKKYAKLYESHAFNGNPKRASLFPMAEDRLCCLMPMYGGSSEGVTKGDYSYAMLGTAESPYKQWTWTKTNLPIWSPRVVEVPNIGFVAIAEIRSAPIRTAVCSLDIKTGQLTELLSLGNIREQQLGVDDHEPLGAEDLPIGLAEHDGFLWVSYNEGPDVFVAKIALQRTASNE